MKSPSLPLQTRACGRARRLVSPLVAGVIATLVASALCGVAAAAPSISGEGTFTYVQGDPPLNIGDGLIVTGGGGYGGEFVEFEIGSSTSSEILSLVSESSADTTAGVVSVVGSDVHLGNGTTTDVVGTIDSTDDGAGGRALRVNFADEFVDAGSRMVSPDGRLPINESTSASRALPAARRSTRARIPDRLRRAPPATANRVSRVVSTGSFFASSSTAHSTQARS